MMPPSSVGILTSDVQSEVDSRTSRRQTETHDDEDGGVRRDTHQHPKHHRQGQRGQQSLGPAQPAGKQDICADNRLTDTSVHLYYYTKKSFTLCRRSQF